MDHGMPDAGVITDFLKGFMHNVGNTVLKWIDGADNPGGSLGVIPNGPQDLVDIGHRMQQQGFDVSEHPMFGGVHPVHVKNSYHYKGRAIDVNWNPAAQEDGKLEKLDEWLKKNVKGIVELLWHVPGHFNHLHLAMAKGGVLNGPTRVLAGEAGPEAIIPLERLFAELEKMMQGAIQPLIDANKGMSSSDLVRLALAGSTNSVSTLSGGTTNNRSGDHIEVTAHTNANAEEIASEIMWKKRIRIR